MARQAPPIESGRAANDASLAAPAISSTGSTNLKRGGLAALTDSCALGAPKRTPHAGVQSAGSGVSIAAPYTDDHEDLANRD